jgi:hypothetical protein
MVVDALYFSAGGSRRRIAFMRILLANRLPEPPLRQLTGDQ